VPVSGSGWNNNILVDGKKQKEHPNFNAVSADYFRTLETPVLLGRAFDDRVDHARAKKVAIVNESFVKKFFADRNPIGQGFQIEEAARSAAAALRDRRRRQGHQVHDLREPFGPIGYFPPAQGDPKDKSPFMQVVLRSNAPLTTVTSEVTAAVAQINPSIVLQFDTMRKQVTESLLRERLMATLSGSSAVWRR
jgi:hypothetical protein